jgi:GTP-binding protein
LANQSLIEGERAAYSPALTERPIWTVLTKVDLLSDEQRDSLLGELRAAHPQRPLFAISSVTGAGVDALVRALLDAVRAHRLALAGDDAMAEAERQLEARIGEDVLKSALEKRPRRSSGPQDDTDDEDDDGDVEVVYVRE